MADPKCNTIVYVKDAIYKVVSAVDGSVLTPTWDGNPRPVLTSTFEGKQEQEWKVKCTVRDGSPFYLIRNEVVKNNEISKEKNRSGNKLENTMIPTDWNIVPSSKNGDFFILSNGIGCLKATGNGERITIEPGFDHDDVQHHWRFEYLNDISAN